MTGTSLVATMASRYSMDPVMFARTLRATVMPKAHTDEEFAAYLMVAERYGLNPILREIYAYPKKGGGIQPVISIDGYINLINSHPQFDGIEITYVENPDGKGKPPISATATIWRKDRSHPTVVTEFYSECYRGTEPWQQMPRRMLRHKAVSQCARVAFGFAGIYDDDEARDIAERPAIEPAKGTVSALDEFIAGAEEIDLDAPADATTFRDSSAGVSGSPSAADEQGGGRDEGLQQASVPADSSSVGSSAMAPHSSGVGSGETLETPRAPSSLPPDAARKALIESAMQLATRPGFETDARLDMLDELRAEAGRLSGLSADIIRDVVTTAAKVAKKELTPKAATKYLESAP